MTVDNNSSNRASETESALGTHGYAKFDASVGKADTATSTINSWTFSNAERMDKIVESLLASEVGATTIVIGSESAQDITSALAGHNAEFSVETLKSLPGDVHLKFTRTA